MTLICAWAMLLTILYLVNEKYPFQGGGDDADYYFLIGRPVTNVEELFDFGRFSYILEQPGYPILLSFFSYIFSDYDLITMKIINVSIFIGTAIVWYKIALAIGPQNFGRVMLIGVLLLTPLWYYFLFLLKDISIVFLQSLFLLGVMKIESGRSLRPWLLILASTGALLLFRSAAVVINLAVLAFSLMSNFQLRQRTSKLLTGIVVISMMGLVLTSPTILSSVGIMGSHRVVGSEEMYRTVTDLSGGSNVSTRGLFPIIYLISEASALNQVAWYRSDGLLIRGILALPWMVVIVPLFLIALTWQLKPVEMFGKPNNFLDRLFKMRLIRTQWRILFFYILVYMAASYAVGDTVRWRIPDMPAIEAVALGGWYNIKGVSMRVMTLLWIIISGVGVVAMYIFVKT